MFGEHGLAPVVGDDLVEEPPGAAAELSDLLHQVVPVRPLGGLLLELLQLLTLQTAHLPVPCSIMTEYWTMNKDMYNLTTRIIISSVLLPEHIKMFPT